MRFLPGAFLLLLAAGCHSAAPTAPIVTADEFSRPVRVRVLGYGGNLMEPFISRDGRTLLFNNLNAAPENTNLHWATTINDSTFRYEGEISGVNTPDLEGVPTLDAAGNLYFVSTRDYAATLATVYGSRFSAGTASGVGIVSGISKKQAGWVNFDVEVSADGQTLYFVDAKFNPGGTPETADLVVAQRTATGFERLPNSDALLKNINATDGLEYAAGISADQLTLYFTRVAAPLGPGSVPEILVATRSAVTEAFGSPRKISSISGFAEGPTVAPDQKTIYFHLKENGKFMLYFTRKK